ncbi:MAG: N-formylglutamate deformylase [Gaiellales bacterium]
MSFDLARGDSPVLVSIPHAGTELPAPLRDRLTPAALALPDTDWHLARLYAFATELGAGLLVARESRYVVDLNRPADDEPMYPGANNTGVVPTRSFAGEALYRAGEEPDTDEQARRIEDVWRPYHHELAAEVARLRERHGFAVLFDAHSIRSELPWLFPGTLPHLNLGTVAGSSCAASLRAALADALAVDSELSSVVDGRFRGGHITRHYGRPDGGIHAVQLELSLRTYLSEGPPPAWDDGQARKALRVLRRFVETLVDWRPE